MRFAISVATESSTERELALHTCDAVSRSTEGDLLPRLTEATRLPMSPSAKPPTNPLEDSVNSIGLPG